MHPQLLAQAGAQELQLFLQSLSVNLRGAAQQSALGAQQVVLGAQQTGAGLQHTGAGAQQVGAGAGAQHVGAGAQQVGAGAQHFGAGLQQILRAGLQQVGAGAQQVCAEAQGSQQLPPRSLPSNCAFETDDMPSAKTAIKQIRETLNMKRSPLVGKGTNKRVMKVRSTRAVCNYGELGKTLMAGIFRNYFQYEPRHPLCGRRISPSGVSM